MNQQEKDDFAAINLELKQHEVRNMWSDARTVFLFFLLLLLYMMLIILLFESA